MSTVELRAEHYRPDDRCEIAQAGTVFAAAIADIAHHEIGYPGWWELTGVDLAYEATRLRYRLDQMTAAVREAQALLATVQRRARLAALRESSALGRGDLHD